MRALGLAIAIALVGCGGSPPPIAGEQQPRQRAEGGPPGDPLTRELARIRGAMEREGLRYGPFEGRGFLGLRERNTFLLEIAPQTCATLVAFTSGGIGDLDATLYTPGGDVLAEDVQPDAHPTLQLCAGAELRRVYYSLAAFDGAGAYVYASFVGDRASFGPAARVVGGRPGIAADSVESTAREARLRELGSGAQRRGFTLAREAVPVPLATDQRVRVPMPVERGFCYTVAAFAQDPLRDADVRVLDEEGHEVARDVTQSPDASLQFCAQRAGDFAVEVHAAQGQGEAHLAIFKAPVASIGGTSGLWLGIRHVERLARGTVREQSARLTHPAYGAARTLASGHLAQAEAIASDLTLAASRCTRIAALGGEGVGEVLLRVVGPDGVIAERIGMAGSVSARVCRGTSTQRVEVEMVVHGGGGDYAIETATRPLPEGMPAGTNPADWGAILDAVEEHGLEPSAARIVDLPASVPLEHAEGSCGHAVVIGLGEGRVAARLVRGGETRARAEGRQIELVACGRSTLEARDGTNVAGQRAVVVVAPPR